MSSVDVSVVARSVRIIVPFYRSPGLVAPLFRSLLACAAELNELGCTVVAINDSPDDGALASALDSAAGELSRAVSCSLRTNRTNTGFLRTVNTAMAEAVAGGHDVILLNSDTVVFPGAFREMIRVARLDAMTGFVSPRSNNATICTFPLNDGIRTSPPHYSYQAFLELRDFLPEYHYVPTVVGFCLFIKWAILAEVGLLDEEYGKGYSEENDLIMRANRLGYRAVLANRAFVYHIGQQSFAVSETPSSVHEQKNAGLLKTRYPEYFDHIHSHFNGPQYDGERLVSAFLPDSDGRRDIVFDCSYFGPYHNGTFNSARHILAEAAATWKDKFNIFVMASAAAAAFHDFGSLPGVMVVPVETTRLFAVAFRFGQPFHSDALLRMSRLAPINIYAMLDTIAWDCLYLNRNQLDLLWRTVAQYADGLMYISEFNRDQFRLRFPVRYGMPEQVCYLSLRTADYNGHTHVAGAGSYYLVVGNSFAHKYIGPTVSSLSTSFPRTKIVALGLDRESAQNVTAYASGSLTAAKIEDLYSHAKAVVFPSTYEGFGIPTMEALAHRKVVFVRDTPLSRTVRQKLGNTKNIVLYQTTSALIGMLAEPGACYWTDDINFDAGYSWVDHAADLRRLIERGIENFSWHDTLMPRLHQMRLLDSPRLNAEYTSVSDGGDAQKAVVDCARLEKSPFDEERLKMLLEQVQHPLVSGLKDVSIKVEAAMNGNAAASSQTAELNGSLSALQAALIDRDARIRELLNSVSWSITAPLRGIGKLFIKGHTKR